jgi:hypothetical protein
MRSVRTRDWRKSMGALGSAAVFLVACGDEAGTEVTAPCSEPADNRGNPLACVAGALIDESGKAAAGVKVSACTESTCIVGTTGDDGRYAIGGLPVEPHKMEILGAMKGFATVVFYQEVEAGLEGRPSRSVVLHALPEDSTPWAPATGGDVSLLDGRLELGVGADVLKYPAGTIDKSVQALEIDIAELPPFDVEPWRGKEGESMAFILNPFPLKATESIELAVTGVEAEAGALYTIYAAHPTTGRLESSGVMMADDAGRLELQPGGSLKSLTTWVIVPN